MARCAAQLEASAGPLGPQAQRVQSLRGVPRRSLGLPSDKELSRRRAIETWPGSAGMFARKKDDGRAEAALLALWGQRRAAGVAA